MSQYLMRLKEVESKKNFHNPLGIELTKPPKALSVSFVSSVSEENKKISDIESQQIGQVRAWLFKIGEPVEDQGIVLNKCRNDPEAMAYFLKHANGEFRE